MTKEKLETALYNTIMLLRDNMPETYWINSEDFISFICIATGITEEEYRKIMKLEA